MVKTAKVLLSIVVAVVLGACSTTAPEAKTPLTKALVGKWRQVDGTRTVQFFAEESMITVDGPRAMAASYKILDDASLEVEPKYHLGARLTPVIVIKASITGDELTLQDGTEKVKYRRER